MTKGKLPVSALVVLIAGCVIAATGFGIRSALGLFLEPMTTERGFSRETYGLALAIQNLFWGLCLPVAGAMADKHGASRVIPLGACFYAAGLYGMSLATSSNALYLTAGVLSGTGIALSAFSLALASMVRVVGAEKRTLVLGLGTAAGSAGQVVFSPLAMAFIGWGGWQQALVWLALISIMLWPLALLLPRSGSPLERQAESQSIGEALTEALHHRGYLLLTAGFFVCGFHVAFITVHFPAYIKDLGLDPRVGAYSIALIGLFNIAGSFLSGWVGQRMSMKVGLSGIYLMRSIVIAAMLVLPKTTPNLLAFAAIMGLLWLSTVPLTTGIIAQVFGVRYMATLFGIVFLSHQLGSFLGVWLGGYFFDQYGSYDRMWMAGIMLGIAAAIIHLPINERPLPRLNQPGHR